MTALLASVRSLAEATIALAGGVDVLDLKDPSHGALAALPQTVIAAVVSAFRGRVPISATAGDLVMEPAMVVGRVAAIASLGVDFVKIGLRPEGDAATTAAAVGRTGLPVVAVLFADLAPDLLSPEALARAGFRGVMLDTAGKSAGGLRSHRSAAELAAFLARAAGLFAGLAGSLRDPDVAPLLALAPDLLGFRGALCAGGRGAVLDGARLAALRAAIPRNALPPAFVPGADGLAGGAGWSIMTRG
ncbi:MAG: (5-formylfuran-3-yl)methyl phosphate synthase [Acetobacteraceae bacterium]